MTQEKTPFVLVVEDDPFYSNVYKTKLSKEGFDVELADSGDAALDIIRKRRPDLVLLDLIMAGKDGFDTLADFQKDPELRDLRVVVLSNLSQDEDIERAKRLGAAEYIVKANVSLQDVIRKIREVLPA